MRYFTKLFLTFFIAISCDTSKQKVNLVEFEDFKITFNDLKSVVKKGNILILNGIDTLHYNKGIAINRLVEKDPKIVYLPTMQDKTEERKRLKQYDSLGLLVVSDRFYDLDKYRKQNVIYKNIDSKEVKIVFPRKEEGITGIYLDSLYQGSKGDVYGTVKINLYGKNLSKKSRESLLKAIETIRFTGNSVN